MTFSRLQASFGASTFFVFILLLSCRYKGWVTGYTLTDGGKKRGRQIVRLHRLWELYLVEDLGMKKEHVHKSAEEMEHILTPELAERLSSHLRDPLFDPHNQPIPTPSEGTAYG